MLGPLITSKTRLKLLLRFFVNQDLSGYLQGLSRELNENSNVLIMGCERDADEDLYNKIIIEGSKQISQ